MDALITPYIQRGLDNAYAAALDAAEEDDELCITERAPTPFESAFAELASAVHASRALPAQARFFFEIPL